MPLPTNPLDDHLAIFTWPKANAGYYWDDAVKATVLLDDAWNAESKNPDWVFNGLEEFEDATDIRQQAINPPYLLAVPRTTKFEGTRVLNECPTLFAEFAGMKPTRDAIVAFANEHGCLTRAENLVCTPTYSYMYGTDRPWKYEAERVVSMNDGSVFAMLPGESLGFWQQEITDISWLVQIWRWLEKKDLTALNKIILWGPEHNFVSFVWADPKTLMDFDSASEVVAARQVQKHVRLRDDPETIKSLAEPGDLLPSGWRLLQQEINQKLSFHRTRAATLWNTSKNELDLYLVPETLLGAIWFQFARAATGGRRYKHCAICKQLEDVTKKQSNWTRHKHCDTNNRTKKHRLIKRIAKEHDHDSDSAKAWVAHELEQGRSLDQITEELDVDKKQR